MPLSFNCSIRKDWIWLLLVIAVWPATWSLDLRFREGFEPGAHAPLVLPPGTHWQWQLSGILDTSPDVAVYDIDLFETSASTMTFLSQAGRKVVCNFSAGSWEAFRPDANDFPTEVLGNPPDPPWQDERWLDIRRIDLLAQILRVRLDLAASTGCFGVEPDNVDGYTHLSGFALTATDQLDFSRWIAS